MPRKGANMRVRKYQLGESNDLAKLIIRGFDGEGDGGDTGGSGGAGEGESDGDPGGDTGGADGDTGGGDPDGDDGGDLPEDLGDLKKALLAERSLRKKAEKGQKLTEREKRKLEKAQQDLKDAEKGEVEAAKKQAQEATEKNAKLAEKLRQSTLERAITDAARKAKFRDPDDVITHLARNKFAGIEVDQDEDDPSDIEIDPKSVEKAVKAVATAKPHWLLAAGDGNPSGSSFNGGKPGEGNKDKAKEYADRFPALRNRVSKS